MCAFIPMDMQDYVNTVSLPEFASNEATNHDVRTKEVCMASSGSHGLQCRIL